MYNRLGLCFYFKLMQICEEHKILDDAQQKPQPQKSNYKPEFTVQEDYSPFSKKICSSNDNNSDKLVSINCSDKTVCTNCTKYITLKKTQNTNSCMQTNRNVCTLTWDNFTAHGDWLERFTRRLCRAWWLTLRDNLTACSDWLEGRVSVGTQGEPVAGFGPSWRALTSGHTGSVPICSSPCLRFSKSWKKCFSFIGIMYRLSSCWKKIKLR